MSLRAYVLVNGSRLLALLLVLGLTAAGQAHARQNELIQHYRLALDLDPDNPALHYYLGVAYLEAGENSAAIDEFTRAYPLYYDSLEMNYNFGLAYARGNDVENALLYLDLADTLGARDQLEIYPIGRIYFNLALTLLERGDTIEGERLLRKVLELNPQQPDAHNLLGDILAKRGETDAALQEFLATLALDPQNDAARDYLFALHYNRALQLIDQKRFEDARPELHEALKFKPDKIISYYYLGYLDYQAQRYPEAVTSLLNITATAPDELRKNLQAMLYNSALALLEQKNPQAAAPVAAYLVGQPTPAARDFFLAANIQLALTDYSAASEFYRKALQADPAHRGAAINLLVAQKNLLEQEFRLGKERFASKDYPLALTHFEKILAIDATYPLARQHAEECRLATEREAQAFFDQAEALSAAGKSLEAVAAVRQGLTLAPEGLRGKTLEKTLLTQIQSDIATGLQRSDTLLAGNDLVAAEAGYRHILTLQPDNKQALNGMQLVEAARTRQLQELGDRFQRLLDLEQAGEAAAVLEQMARLAPTAPQNEQLRQKLSTWIGQQSEAKVRAGRRAFAEQRVDEGRQLFLAALALHDVPALREELARLEAAHDRNYSDLINKFRSLLTSGDFKKARSYLTQLATLGPGPSAHQTLQSEYTTAVSQVSNRYLAAAVAKAAAKNWRGALEDYRQVLDLDPTNPQAQQGLRHGKTQLQTELAQLIEQGQSFTKRGDLDQAEKIFRKALDLDPYQQAARDGLTRLSQVKQTGSRPGDENTLYLQGIDLYTRGRYDDAVAVWEKVLVLAPKHDKARMNIEKARRKIEQIKAYRNE